jgi:hypothetical protein
VTEGLAAGSFRYNFMNYAIMFNGVDQKVLERRAQAGIAKTARYPTFRRVLLTA